MTGWCPLCSQSPGPARGPRGRQRRAAQAAAGPARALQVRGREGQGGHAVRVHLQAAGQGEQAARQPLPAPAVGAAGLRRCVPGQPRAPASEGRGSRLGPLLSGAPPTPCTNLSLEASFHQCSLSAHVGEEAREGFVVKGGEERQLLSEGLGGRRRSGGERGRKGAPQGDVHRAWEWAWRAWRAPPAAPPCGC